jgi:hypothetical protein
MASYQITEPHPTTLTNHYIHTGRGGAGNTIRVAPSTSTAGSSKLSTLSKTPSNTSSIRNSTKASTGRGGAGNIYPHSALSHFSLSDEMDAQAARESGREVWHVGRGGAGNLASQKAGGSGRRRVSNESVDSTGSARSGFFGKLSGALERH